MHDDTFDNVEVLAKKDFEIENLKKTSNEQIAKIQQLEREVQLSRRIENEEKSSSGMENETRSSTGMENEEKSIRENIPTKRKKSEKLVPLPKSFKRIKLRLKGEKEWLHGKVLSKHKGKSMYKNILGMRFDDGF